MKLIPLTRGMFAIVDDDNFTWLNKWKWYADKGKTNKTYYAGRNHRERPGFRYHIKMHQEILGLTRGNKMLTDHINRNGLDNRRENLRICTRRQNACNAVKGNGRHGLSCISFKQGSYQVRSQYFGKDIYGGFWKSLIDAIRYRNCMVRILHGEFAVLLDVNCINRLERN